MDPRVRALDEDGLAVEDMKEGLMVGKVVFVTGSTDGIGKETALGMAGMGARVLLHGRNAEKGRRVAEEIRENSGNDDIEFFLEDFSSQREVRLLAAEVEAYRRGSGRSARGSSALDDRFYGDAASG